MNEKHSQTMNEQEATVNEIVRSAREGGLTGEVLGKILEHRLGAVNCYPGQPTHTCHQIAYFIALEGRMGHQLQLELAHAEWEAERPTRWWVRHHPFRYWDLPRYSGEEPPYTCAYMLERLVRHVQGCCAGTTREAVLITDTWNPEAFERWRGNLDAIGRTASIAIYLIGEGSLCTRLI